MCDEVQVVSTSNVMMEVGGGHTPQQVQIIIVVLCCLVLLSCCCEGFGGGGFDNFWSVFYFRLSVSRQWAFFSTHSALTHPLLQYRILFLPIF